MRTLKDFKGMLWDQEITVNIDNVISHKNLRHAIILEEYGPVITYFRAPSQGGILQRQMQMQMQKAIR